MHERPRTVPFTMLHTVRFAALTALGGVARGQCLSTRIRHRRQHPPVGGLVQLEKSPRSSSRAAPIWSGRTSMCGFSRAVSRMLHMVGVNFIGALCDPPW
jgi:hypothetical protein